MSLLEKLSQKKAEKVTKEKEELNASKAQSVEELAASIAAANDKKARLEAMLRDLDSAFKGGNRALDSFKGKKAQLQGAFKEHQDILAEEGVNDFQEMLEANADESDVKDYRRSGGRAPKNTNEEMGSTGALYSGVKTIVDLKTAIQAEMPDIKLNFAATKKKGEEISNRDASFAAVTEYLKTLDQDVIKLQNQKDQTYLETDAGKRDLINKNINVERELSDVNLNNKDRFYFADATISLSEKVGSEIIKEVYTNKLTKKLQAEALSNKNKDQRNSYNKSEEQLAIENHSALKELIDAKYNRQEMRESQALYQEALKHLSTLFKDEGVKRKMIHYGFSRGYSNKEYQNWDQENILADRYLKHMQEMGHLIPGFQQSSENFNSLVEQFEANAYDAHVRDYRKNIYRPEYYKACFENYNIFFNYIKNETNIDSDFLGDKSTQGSVLNKFSNRDSRQELGMNELRPEEGNRFLVPKDYIDNNGGFSRAWEKSYRSGSAWEKEKADLEKLSKALVDFRWAQSMERWHGEKNREVISEYDYNDGLAKNIRHQLATSRLLKDPSFKDRKIRLIDGGFSQETVIKDLSNEEEFSKNNEERKAIQEEINIFTNEKKQKLEKAMGSIRRGLLVFNKESKLEDLDKRWKFFDYLKGDNLANWNPSEGGYRNYAKKSFSEEEVSKIEKLIGKQTNNRSDYQVQEQKRLVFLHASSSNSFYLKFRPNDILNNQEMTVAELPSRLQDRLSELEVALNNLPEKEAAIIEERNKINEELKRSKQAVDEVVSKINK